ncbi:hypothetical protein ALC57_16784, partial [Trachymyrmex cornetzi]
KVVKEKFEEHFGARVNIVLERARFNRRKQMNEETVENFIADLYRLVETCNFGALKDELIRDRIVAGIKDIKLSEALQCDPELTLEKAINKVRTKEEVKTQQAVIRGMEMAANLDRVRSSHGTHSKRGLPNRSQQQRMKEETTQKNCCSRCGITPKHAFSSCPAKLSECNNCKKKGHWAAVCKKKNIHEVNRSDDDKKANEDDKEDLYLGASNGQAQKERKRTRGSTDLESGDRNDACRTTMDG